MKTIKTALVALVGFLFAAGSEAQAQVPMYREQRRTVIVNKRPVVPEYRVIRERNFGGYRHNRYYDNRFHRNYWYNNGRRMEYRRMEHHHEW